MFKYIDTPKLVAHYLREFALDKEGEASLIYKFILCVVLPFVSQRFRRARLIALAIAECTQSQDQIVRVLKKIVAFETGLDEADVQIDVTTGDEHLYVSYDKSNDANQQTSYEGSEDDLGAPYAEMQNIITFTVYDEATLQIVNKYIALLVPFYVKYEVVLYVEPTMQFTIYVEETLYAAEYRTNKDDLMTALEGGDNVISVPADFTTMYLGAESEGGSPVVVVVGDRGDYIGTGTPEYAVFNRQYYPNVTKLSIQRSEEVSGVSTITMETNGQGDIEYEITAYPSETIVGSFTDDAGTTELSEIPDGTVALVFYGYDAREDAPHTPTVYNGTYTGQDGYTTLFGEDIYAIAGETITIE